MVFFTFTQACTKEVTSPAIREGSEMGATVVKPLSVSPPLTTDGVDKMYYQLMEIHAISTVQLAECAPWRRFDPANSPVRAGAGWQRLTVVPSVVVLAPSPPIDFSSQAPLW
jgi:hypothetical protein